MGRNVAALIPHPLEGMLGQSTEGGEHQKWAGVPSTGLSPPRLLGACLFSSLASLCCCSWVVDEMILFLMRFYSLAAAGGETHPLAGTACQGTSLPLSSWPPRAPSFHHIVSLSLLQELCTVFV